MVYPLAQSPPHGRDVVVAEYKAQVSYKIEVLSHFDYYFHGYSAIGLGLCCSEVVDDFEKLNPEEVVDVEAVLYVIP